MNEKRWFGVGSKNDLHPPVEQVMDAKEADYVC
jgi:hypothetical protein